MMIGLSGLGAFPQSWIDWWKQYGVDPNNPATWGTKSPVTEKPWCKPGQVPTLENFCECTPDKRMSHMKCVPAGACLLPPNLQCHPYVDYGGQPQVPGKAVSEEACDPVSYAEMSRPEANHYLCHGTTPPWQQFDWWNTPVAKQPCPNPAYSVATDSWVPADPATGCLNLSAPVPPPVPTSGQCPSGQVLVNGVCKTLDAPPPGPTLVPTPTVTQTTAVTSTTQPVITHPPDSGPANWIFQQMPTPWNSTTVSGNPLIQQATAQPIDAPAPSTGGNSLIYLGVAAAAIWFLGRAA